MIVTKAYIEKNKTVKGSWTRKQIEALGIEWPPRKGWKKRIIGHVLTDQKAAVFEQKKKTKKEQKVLNAVSVDNGKDWAWKPDKTDIPPVKIKPSKKNKNRGKKKAKRQKVARYDNDYFYSSREWRELRVRVIEKYESKCMMCGRSPKDHGIVIHCDHIKPRSKYPNLSLTFDNLQLLCEDCNLGKSNKYDTDWRPELDEREQIDALLDLELLNKGHYNDI